MLFSEAAANFKARRAFPLDTRRLATGLNMINKRQNAKQQDSFLIAIFDCSNYSRDSSVSPGLVRMADQPKMLSEIS